jgi:hypothetical protein
MGKIFSPGKERTQEVLSGLAGIVAAIEEDLKKQAK